MISGIGTDICHIGRVKKLLARHGARFIARLLTPAERKTVKPEPAALARRYAAKEAVSKAVGTGIGKKLSFQDVTITRRGNQPPTVTLSPKARKELGKISFHLSLSDDTDYAVAFVVAEQKEPK